MTPARLQTALNLSLDRCVLLEAMVVERDAQIAELRREVQWADNNADMYRELYEQSGDQAELAMDPVGNLYRIRPDAANDNSNADPGDEHREAA